MHRLSNKNIEAKTGDCVECGPGVRIVAKVKGRYSCARQGVAPDACEVCGSTKKICWDHDHATGNHRGWLCDRCNRILGAARDDPAVLRGLAKYLEN